MATTVLGSVISMLLSDQESLGYPLKYLIMTSGGSELAKIPAVDRELPSIHPREILLNMGFRLMTLPTSQIHMKL